MPESPEYERRARSDGPRSHRRDAHSDSDEIEQERRSHRKSSNRGDRSRDRARNARDDEGHRSKRRRRSIEDSRHRTRSRSPHSSRRVKQARSRSTSPAPVRSRAALPSQDASFRGNVDPDVKSDQPQIEKQKPNFKPTGLLAKEANTVTGTSTVLKYHEPAEARKPPTKEPWRMYVFRKKDLLDTVYLHQRSCWLVGRDQNVTDLALDHPSISKQHAVIQFRHRTSTNQYGDKSSKVKPYLIDLESANGTKLNGEKVEASRYFELVDGDVVSFGDSEREYVMMLPPPG